MAGCFAGCRGWSLSAIDAEDDCRSSLFSLDRRLPCHRAASVSSLVVDGCTSVDVRARRYSSNGYSLELRDCSRMAAAVSGSGRQAGHEYSSAAWALAESDTGQDGRGLRLVAQSLWVPDSAALHLC